MTLPRSERDTNDVLYDLAISYPGGFNELARRIGTTPEHLRKRMGPGTKERAPTLKDFSLTVEMCQGSGVKNALDPLRALCWRHGGVFIPIRELDDISDDSILRGAALAMQHIGEVTGTVNAALDDGEITDRHMDKIEPKFRRALTAMCTWLARVKGRMKRDTSKPRSRFFRKAVDDSTTTTTAQ